jgi:V8-like Glu-specific endopeptidase
MHANTVDRIVISSSRVILLVMSGSRGALAHLGVCWLKGMCLLKGMCSLKGVASLVSVFMVLGLGASPAGAFESRIMGGSGAGGSSNVVAISGRDENGWWLCSAAIWKPRILVTAAHCVTKRGSADPALEVRVFPPGAEALVYSNIGPQGASAVPVTSILRPAGYVNASELVQPNDIAFLVLGSDLAPAGFGRLATSAELTNWASIAKPITHVGYGLTGPNQRSTTPHTTTLSLVEFMNGRYGQQFSTAQTAQVSICPGDSGSPAFVDQASGDLLLGTMAGGTGPCRTTEGAPASTTAANVGLAVMGYLDLADAALAQAGYPLIPGAPMDRAGTSASSTVFLAWLPPSRNANTVTSYEVVDENDSVVCSTVATTCRVEGVTPGDHSYRVRSLNSQGEGDARPEAIAVRVGDPPAVIGLKNARATPVVSGVRITAQEGCFAARQGRRNLQAETQSGWVKLASATLVRDRQRCPKRKQPYLARYEFTVPTVTAAATPIALRTVGPANTQSRQSGITVYPSYEALLTSTLQARNPAS